MVGKFKRLLVVCCFFSGRRDASPPRQAGRLTLQLWAAIRLDGNSPVSFLKGMKAAGDGKISAQTLW
jgi:hypothetical protein